MAKLYGKLWNQKMAMSTRTGSSEITAQLLYESPTMGRTVAVETWIIRGRDGIFRLSVRVPSWNTEEIITYDLS